MDTEPSSSVIASSLPAERRSRTLRRMDAVMVVWLLGWPVVFFSCTPLATPGDPLGVWLLGAGSFIWLMSCCWTYGLLFMMAEARWPAAAGIRKFLSFVFGLLRAFQGHHSL